VSGLSADEESQWLEELMILNDSEKKMTEKQIRIVEAAVDIFSLKGYSAASTSEIAQKAGVAEGTIFRHYKTKKDLLFSIVGPIMAKMVAPMLMKDFAKQVIEQKYDRFEDFLRAIIVNRIAFVRKYLPVLKIVLYEIPYHPELREQISNEITHNVLDKFILLVQHFQKQGQIINIPSMAVIRLVVSTMLGFVLARFLFLPDHAWDDGKEIDLTIDFILYGLSPNGRLS
jgi:AcrR family transcriptional regulator